MSATLDKIFIRDLVCRTYIGIFDWEQERLQEILIQVTLYADLKKAGNTDKLEDTVNYKQLKNDIITLAEGNRYQLIERMAEAIAQLCLKEKLVQQVCVSVDKPGALRFARSVGVEVCRSKADIQA